MPYNMSIFRSLAAREVDLHIVHWDGKGRRSAYKFPPIEGVRTYKRSLFGLAQMLMLAIKVNPSVLIVNGWMDRSYILVALLRRVFGTKVILASDNVWIGSKRQQVARLLGRLGFFRSLFTHAWVPGELQFSFVNSLGIPHERIIYGLYCADICSLGDIYRLRWQGFKSKPKSTSEGLRTILYIGRFETCKGVLDLIEAWKNIEQKIIGWRLVMIGSGSIRLLSCPKRRIEVLGFLQPDELKNWLLKADCAVMPSHTEPWGVVVHEATASGLPIIVSDEVGSASMFFSQEFNGYSFQARSVVCLEKSLLKIACLSEAKIKWFSENSRALSLRLTPDLVADAFLAKFCHS